MSRRAVRKRVVLVVVACTSGAAPVLRAAETEPAPMPVAWVCTQEYDARFHVRCAPTVAATDAPEPPRVRGGPFTQEAHPADGNVPALPAPIPMRLSYEVWRIPLDVRPSDAERVMRWLEVALCGRDPECTVAYEAGALEAALATRHRPDG